MKKIGFCLLAVTAAGVTATWSQQAHSAHVMVTTHELKWGEAPPVLPKGAQLVVLSGDPSQAGLYSLRLRMPAGYKIAPHWHPTDEHVTVISGTFSMGIGEKFEAATARDLAAGSYAVMPAQERHYAWTRGGATVQVDGMGPFPITYVNPADDPTRVASK